MQLPEAFLVKMEGLLGEEFGAFLESYGREAARGLRWNPLKAGDGAGRERFAGQMGLAPIPWAREGRYYDKDARPGRHAWHEAGAFYIQEPSAMAAAEVLDARPGEKVLDLCAAPGGKSTQIAGQLLGEGLLVSNEIHPARARILSQNVERMGIANAVVTSEDAQTLAGRFPCFFDKVMVDAPCSGEGMFRKDEQARNQWSPERVAMCAARQAGILDCAGAMLKPGGRLVYSTCTFSPEENEGSVSAFLKRNPEFFVEQAAACPQFDRGRPEWVEGGQAELARTLRIWPHHAGGEGHYLAALKKAREERDGGEKTFRKPPCVKDRQVIAAWREFCLDALTEEGMRRLGGPAQERLVLFGRQLCLIPEEMPDYAGLKVLRAGLHLGTIKKDRLEPAHGLALFLRKEEARRSQAWTGEGREMAAYLRGEALEASETPEPGGDGWTLVLADEYSAGWAKKVGNTLKNHYPRGLRRG